MLTPQNPHFLVERDIRAFEELLKLWLHGKAPHTQRYYRREIDRFFQFAQKSPEAIALLRHTGVGRLAGAVGIGEKFPSAIAGGGEILLFVCGEDGGTESQCGCPCCSAKS